MRTWAVFLVAFTSAFLATPISGAPEVKNAEECYWLGDLAVVARSLSATDVSRRKANAIIRRIYDIKSERVEELAGLILEQAYRERTDSAREFGQRLYRLCTRNGGNVDELLGENS